MNTTENKVSYNDAVLSSNKAFKEEKTKLGGAIKRLKLLKILYTPFYKLS